MQFLIADIGVAQDRAVYLFQCFCSRRKETGSYFSSPSGVTAAAGDRLPNGSGGHVVHLPPQHSSSANQVTCSEPVPPSLQAATFLQLNDALQAGSGKNVAHHRGSTGLPGPQFGLKQHHGPAGHNVPAAEGCLADRER